MWIDQWHVVDIVDVVVVVVVVVVGNGCMVVIHRASARGRQSIKLKKPWFEQVSIVISVILVTFCLDLEQICSGWTLTWTLDIWTVSLMTLRGGRFSSRVD
ncbi:hypothetical protein I7I53_04257 [Histoplasma capsulatum var. duboisii H88]|uniref:Uncharacterized protein n=1 Tax=Ajellomyces capsulatus (strain H88) TaxID=544711 RepID=A0A8A1LQC0_AJEC8|nr:hypothetical protein I7I53_04257 [Histoplasma capsulatum var. duboisii H88]